MNQSCKEHLTYTKGPVAKIGETGGTVVYIFPGGKACVKKGKKGQKDSSSAHSKTANQITVQKVGDRLVQAGVINSTQLQVALYDQKTMNLRLGDVLIARGWIDQATLDAVLTD